MQNSRPAAERGVIVHARGGTWRLVERQVFERCALITLLGLDQTNLGETLQVLEPFERLVHRTEQSRVRLAGRWQVARRVAEELLATHQWRTCWTAASARIDLLPWQLEPTFAVLGGATRILLADGAGRGKTVQAALILSELSARGLIQRALILTPAGLRGQWADELWTRFRLHASVLDQSALARDATNLPAGTNPWAAARVIISSIDLVKRAETLAGIDGVPFDLLIVDEAHHVTPDTDRGTLVARLAERTPWVVLVSATPHSGDERAFQFLHDAGATPSDRLAIFRRAAPRSARSPRTRVVRLRPSAEERALLDGVRRYAEAIWRQRGATSNAARLVAMVLARRAASSAEAALVSLTRRRALLAEPETARLREQPPLPWEEHDDRDGLEADYLLSAPGLDNAGQEHRQLDELIACARRAGPSATKGRWIERLVMKAREPIIVFSEFRDTIEALRTRFEPILPIAVLHGGLSPSLRHAATSSFVAGGQRLLLATDAGGEGLNLQARCRTVVNIELPWNPLRLAQRIGRVDRLGQSRRVHAVHLLHRGSIEETVLAHLSRRAARIDAHESSMGDRSTIESRVAESVLGGAAISPPPPLCPSDAEPSAIGEAGRLETLRMLRAASSRSAARRHHDASLPPYNSAAAPGTYVSVPRRGTGPARVARCVFTITISNACGYTGASPSLILPIAIELSNAFPDDVSQRMKALRSLIERLHAAPAVRTAVTTQFGVEQLARQTFVRAVRTRVRTLVGDLGNGRHPFQPALFDDRAANRAIERASVQEAHRARLTRLDTLLGDPDTLVTGPLQLIAAWLETEVRLCQPGSRAH